MYGMKEDAEMSGKVSFFLVYRSSINNRYILLCMFKKGGDLQRQLIHKCLFVGCRRVRGMILQHRSGVSLVWGQSTETLLTSRPSCRLADTSALPCARYTAGNRSFISTSKLPHGEISIMKRWGLLHYCCQLPTHWGMLGKPSVVWDIKWYCKNKHLVEVLRLWWGESK